MRTPSKVASFTNSPIRAVSETAKHTKVLSELTQPAQPIPLERNEDPTLSAPGKSYSPITPKAWVRDSESFDTSSRKEQFSEKKSLSFLSYPRASAQTRSNPTGHLPYPFANESTDQAQNQGQGYERRHHSYNLDDVMLVPAEQVILVDASNSYVNRFGGRAASRFLVNFTHKTQPFFITIWSLDSIICLIRFSGGLFIPAWLCMAVGCITVFYLTVLMTMLQPNIVKLTLMNFETCYLLIIVLLNTYFLADVICWESTYLSSVCACLLSFIFGIFMDSNSISFKRFNKEFNKKISDRSSSEIELDASDHQNHLVFNHPTLNNTIFSWMKTAIDTKSGWFRLASTQFAAMNLFNPWYQYIITLLAGIANELGVYIMLRFDLMQQKCVRSVKILWMEWNSDEILIILCANLVLFLTKRMIIMALRPGRVSTIKKNMMMIPLVPYWHSLDIIIQSRDRENIAVEYLSPNKEEDQFKKIRAYFNHYRLVAFFCPSSTFSFSYEPTCNLFSLKNLPNALYYLDLMWFYIWILSMPTCLLSLSLLNQSNFPAFFAVCTVGFAYGVSRFRHYCSKILLRSIYSFENVYVFACFSLACVSLADYLSWSDPKTYVSVPLIYLIYFHGLFYGAQKRDNELFDEKLQKLFHENLDTLGHSPFTHHLLQSVRCYGAHVNRTNQRYVPELIQYDQTLYPSLNPDDLQNHPWSDGFVLAPFPKLTRKEWWIYTKLFGSFHLLMTWIPVIFTIAIYLLIETGNIQSGQERTIYLVVIELSNRAVLNSSLSNLLLFCLKRSFTSTFNPFLTPLFEVSHFRTPVVDNLLIYMKQIQDAERGK